MRKGATAVLAIFLAASCGRKEEKILEAGTAGTGDPGYAYKLTVEKMQFHWRLDKDELHVKLRAPVAAWLSAGFNPSKGMKNADLIIGYMENGKAVITDQHGIDPKNHRKDTDLGGEDDVRKASGSRTDGETVISFSIPVRPSDKLDKPILPDAVVMLAYGKSDQTVQQHAFWAKARVNLSSGTYAVTLLKKGE